MSGTEEDRNEGRSKENTRPISPIPFPTFFPLFLLAQSLPKELLLFLFFFFFSIKKVSFHEIRIDIQSWFIISFEPRIPRKKERRIAVRNGYWNRQTGRAFKSSRVCFLPYWIAWLFATDQRHRSSPRPLNPLFRSAAYLSRRGESRQEYMIRPRVSRRQTSNHGPPPTRVTHGPTCQARPHTRRNLVGIASRVVGAFYVDTGCVPRYFLFARSLLFSLFFFSHAFSKAIQWGLFEARINVSWERQRSEERKKVIKFSRLIIPPTRSNPSVVSRVSNLLQLTRRKELAPRTSLAQWTSLSNSLWYFVACMIRNRYAST